MISLGILERAIRRICEARVAAGASVLIQLALSPALAHGATLLAQFDSMPVLNTPAPAGMAFGLYYGDLTVLIGSPITSITGDAFIGFDQVYDGPGQFDFNAGNSPRFDELVAFLTNDVEDIITTSDIAVTAADLVAFGSGGTGFYESDVFGPEIDLTGRTVEFIRLSVHSVSLTSDLAVADTTWEFWGEGAPLAGEPQTWGLVVGGLGALWLRRRRLI
jgi:MYXO-CTERM domain-containing protein